MFTATMVPNSFFSTVDVNIGERNPFFTTASVDDDVTITSGPPAPFLQRYSDWYSGYHGYASLAVCAIGIVGNVLNVAVLTRANMAASSTNFILTALAVSDLLKMASYVPFAIQFYCRRHADQPSDPGSGNTAGWTIYLMFHVNFSVTSHTASIWLGVLLSVFRYMHVRPPSTRSSGGTRGGGAVHSQFMTAIGQRAALMRARGAVAVVCILTIVGMVPNYLSLAVRQNDITIADNSTATTYDLILSADINSTWTIVGAKLPPEVAAVVVQLNFWIHAVLVKLVPCALMLIFGSLLVATTRDSRRRALKLQRQHGNEYQLSKQRRRLAERNRTTWMLVAVVVLFLLTELPQGVLSVCSGLVNGCFESFYSPLGDTMDIVALVNNGINFALYCTMSARFRQTFAKMVLDSCCLLRCRTMKRQLITGRSRGNSDVTTDVTAAASEPRLSCARASITLNDSVIR